MMKKDVAVSILWWTMIFFAGVLFTFGQEKETDLRDKRITIKVDKQPLGKVFELLIVNYDIPIGFEESTFDRDHNDFEFETNLPDRNKKVFSDAGNDIDVSIVRERVFPVKNHWFTINLEDSKLEGVLNAIVGQMKNYKWEINDDVVNIFPIRGRDEKFADLLALNIQNFDLGIGKPRPKGNPIFLIRNRIFELPEVVKFLDDKKILHSKLYRESLDNLERKIPDVLNFSNLKFRDLLNKITKIKRGGWILKKRDMHSSKAEESIEINI